MNILKKIYHKLKLIKNITRIKSGVIANYKWIKNSGCPEFPEGTYENEIVEHFYNHALKSNVIFDLGAQLGYYSLIASKAVGNKGKVYAFEPLPFNISHLKKHISINLSSG